MQEAHVVAGAASLLVKVRTADTTALQDVLRRIFDIEGVVATQAIVVLDTFFERPHAPMPEPRLPYNGVPLDRGPRDDPHRLEEIRRRPGAPAPGWSRCGAIGAW